MLVFPCTIHVLTFPTFVGEVIAARVLYFIREMLKRMIRIPLLIMRKSHVKTTNTMREKSLTARAFL